MMIGKALRMGRIFQPDGKTVIVAMDHCLPHGDVKGLEHPEKLVEQLIEGGTDGILTSFGIVKRIYPIIRGHLGLILRIDGAVTAFSPRDCIAAERLVLSVDEALVLGADAVATMGNIGSDIESESLGNVAYVSEECEKYGVPYMAEMTPMSPGSRKPVLEQVSAATRIGGEYGADFIKSIYTGTIESFKTVVENSLVPVIIRGGAHKSDSTDRDLLTVVYESVQAGGVGVAMGRNIWQHPHPEKMTRAIVRIVHHNASVDEALEYLS